jgi:16S rRNA (uracil1498-N3)-methyltransferase
VIRLHVEGPLTAEARLQLAPEPSRYLLTVMRQGPGDRVLVFNGRDGEWRARLVEAGKRGAVLALEARTRDQETGPDLELLIALVKRARLETIVEKAAELGARRVRLVLTRRTQADHTNVARLQAIATEAAEQTGRLDVPEVVAPEKLDRMLAGWEAGRALVFCDEAGEAPPALDALRGAAGPAAILIGPEGGFDPTERDALRAMPFVTPVNLGPRILRADTAAISALTLWQAAAGDWRGS